MAGFIFVLTTLVISCLAQMEPTLYEGDVCKLKNGKKGLCKLLSDCKPAYERLNTTGFSPEHCNHKLSDEVVCCDDEVSQSLRISDIECRQYSNKVPFRVTPLIKGGQDAEPGDYPYMAALGYEYDPLEPSKIAWNCGGSLISDRFVLTVAHCVVSTVRTKAPVKVLLGSVNLDNPKSQIYGVKSLTVHPNYTARQVYNDIALVELDRSVMFSEEVQPACLNTKSDIPDVSLRTTGWGSKSSEREDRRSKILQYAQVRIVPKNKCSEAYKNVGRLKDGIVDTMICADDSQDRCYGTSGDPIQMQSNETNSYIIVGITSFGLTYCGGTTPTIYTRVDRYLDWIESIVWKRFLS